MHPWNLSPVQKQKKVFGFFLAFEDLGILGGKFDQSFPAWGDISSRAPVPLFGLGPGSFQSGSAETTMAERWLTSCVWARYPDWLSKQLSQLNPTSLGHEYNVCVFRCNLPLHFWQDDRFFLRATAVTRKWKRTPNTSHHRNYLFGRKFSRRSC